MEDWDLSLHDLMEEDEAMIRAHIKALELCEKKQTLCVESPRVGFNSRVNKIKVYAPF